MAKGLAHRKTGNSDDVDRSLVLSKDAAGPDPRLVELIRLLARRAAQDWYGKQSGDRRQTRS